MLPAGGCSHAGPFSPWRAGVSQLPRVGVEDPSPTCLGTSSLLIVLGDASLGSSEGERWSLQGAECLGSCGASLGRACARGVTWALLLLEGLSWHAHLSQHGFPQAGPLPASPNTVGSGGSRPPGASLPYDFLFGLHLSCMYTADLITCWLQTPHKSEHGHQAAPISFCEYSLVDFICQFPIFQAQFFRSLFSRRHDCSAGQCSCPLL